MCVPSGLRISWQVPQSAALSRDVLSWSVEYAEWCTGLATGAGFWSSARIVAQSFDKVTFALYGCAVSTDSAVWQKMHVTPWYFVSSVERFSPSVVFWSRTAIGAWHLTQKAPRPPSVSRWPRWFMATKTGSSEAFAWALASQSW